SLLSEATRRFVQTVVYLPHFLSWVIVISIWAQVVGGDGLVATLLSSVGVDGFNAMGNSETFKILVVARRRRRTWDGGPSSSSRPSRGSPVNSTRRLPRTEPVDGGGRGT